MRNLVISSLEEITPTPFTGVDIYLGPWCFHKREHYSILDMHEFEVLPSPWDTLAEYKRADDFTQNICSRLLIAITQYANMLHGTSHSVRFWEKVVYAWLQDIMTMMYDNYIRLKRTEEYGEITVNILPRTKYRVNNYNVFNFALDSPYLASLLISDVIRGAKSMSWISTREVRVPQTRLKQELTIKDPHASQRALRDAQILKRISGYLNERGNIFLSNITGISIRNEIILKLLAEPFCFLQRKSFTRKRYREPATPYEPNLPFTPENEFESIAHEAVERYLPRVLYNYESYSFNRKVIAYGFHHFLHNNEYFYAHLQEQGGQWISVQHGCGYGDRLFPNLSREFKLVDRFISWGWEKKKTKKFVPLPAPYLAFKPKKSSAERQHLLFATTRMVSPYPYRLLKSNYLPEAMRNNFSQRIQFLESLDESIFNNTIYRPHVLRINNYFDEEQPIQDRLPDLTIRSSLVESFVNVISKTKLFVSNTCELTPFFQSMAMGIPCIFFQDKDPQFYTEEFRQTLNLLEEAQILHKTAQTAAQCINQIWYEIQDWWNEPKRQDAVQTFCRHWAWRKDDWYKDWLVFLRNEKTELIHHNTQTIAAEATPFR